MTDEIDTDPYAKFTWLRSLNASEIKGHARPVTLQDLIGKPDSSESRKVYAQLFREWLSAPQPTHAKYFILALNARLAGEDVTTVVDLGTAAATYGEALDKWWALFETELGQLKAAMDGSHHLSSDVARAAERARLRALGEQGFANTVLQVLQMGDVKKEINDGINFMAILRDLGNENGWKAYDKVIAGTIGAAILQYGTVEGELRKTATVYRDHPSETTLVALADVLAEYTSDCEKLGRSLEKASEEASKFMIAKASAIAEAELSTVLPEVAHGLLAFHEGVYICSTILTAISPAFPPAAIAAGILGVASLAITALVTKIAIHEAIKNDPTLVDKLLLSKFHENDKRAGELKEVLDRSADLFDKEQIGESALGFVATITDKIAGLQKAAGGVTAATTNMQAVNTTISNLTNASGQVTGPAGYLVAGFEISSEFYDADGKTMTWDPDAHPKAEEAFSRVRGMAGGRAKSSGEYRIFERNSDGDYIALVGGIRGIIETETGTFLPDDHQTAFKSFLGNRKSAYLRAVVRAWAGGSEEDRQAHVDIEASADLADKHATLARSYDARNACLILDVLVTYRMQSMLSRDLDEDDRNLIVEANQNTTQMRDMIQQWVPATLDIAGSVYFEGSAGEDALPDPPRYWLEATYIPWRIRFPQLLTDDHILKDDHPYLKYYAKIVDGPEGAPRSIEITSTPVPEEELQDYDVWSGQAKHQLEDEWKRLS